MAICSVRAVDGKQLRFVMMLHSSGSTHSGVTVLLELDVVLCVVAEVDVDVDGQVPHRAGHRSRVSTDIRSIPKHSGIKSDVQRSGSRIPPHVRGRHDSQSTGQSICNDRASMWSMQCPLLNKLQRGLSRALLHTSVLVDVEVDDLVVGRDAKVDVDVVQAPKELHSAGHSACNAATVAGNAVGRAGSQAMGCTPRQSVGSGWPLQRATCVVVVELELVQVPQVPGQEFLNVSANGLLAI